MRQYLVVGIGVLVLVVGLVAKRYLDKQQAPAAAPIEAVVRAGQGLKEALATAKPDQLGGLEAQFNAVATACAGPGAVATPAAKQMCERAAVLRQAAKAGTATPEGVRDVQQAMDALAASLAPAK